MLPRWIDATQAHSLGVSLATQFMAGIEKDVVVSNKKFKSEAQVVLIKLDKQIQIRRAEHRFNFYQKAKLGNAFKWTLLDAGYDQEYVDQLTEWLMVRF